MVNHLVNHLVKCVQRALTYILSCTVSKLGYGRLLGRPTLVGKASSFTHELSFLSFLSIHRAQQPRSKVKSQGHSEACHKREYSVTGRSFFWRRILSTAI